MAAYVIFDVDIRDANRYQDFMKQVKPALDAAGARYLARGGAHKVYEAIGVRDESCSWNSLRSQRGSPSTTDQCTKVSSQLETNAVPLALSAWTVFPYDPCLQDIS